MTEIAGIVKMVEIVDFQKFSLFDGDGIRTSVFFKGCALECAWCHNPETINFYKELLYDSEKCISCGSCIKFCPSNALSFNNNKLIIDNSKCSKCGTCTDYCIKSAFEIAGNSYSLEDIIKEIDKDRIFYDESHGGVTFTGGEFMLQDIDFLESLCIKLKQKGYHLTGDTSGFAPLDNFKRLLPYIDVYLYDLKFIDNLQHKKYTNQSNELILSNLIFLSENKAKINIRLPIIDGVNATKEHVVCVKNFLTENKINPFKINLLPYHNIGMHKYGRLGKKYNGSDFKPPTPEMMDVFLSIFKNAGFDNVHIGA